jgi:hypothetical protein
MFRNVMVVFDDLRELQRALELAIEWVVSGWSKFDSSLATLSINAAGAWTERRTKE